MRPALAEPLRANPRPKGSVDVTVMEVGHMRVIVSQPHVGMPVRVRLDHRFFVRVLMVLIVRVQMLMLDRLMRVEMPMVLANQCGNAHHHESASHERDSAWAVAEIAPCRAAPKRRSACILRTRLTP